MVYKNAIKKRKIMMFKAQYCPSCFTRLCYCFDLHRSEASIVHKA